MQGRFLLGWTLACAWTPEMLIVSDQAVDSKNVTKLGTVGPGRGVLKLSEALFRNTTLQTVDLALNSFGPEGKDALLDVMDFSFRWSVHLGRLSRVEQRNAQRRGG